jgi:hypothetical protein
MTSTIFLNFLHKFDAKIGLAHRMVLPFVGKCPAHPLGHTVLEKCKGNFSSCKLHEYVAAA